MIVQYSIDNINSRLFFFFFHQLYNSARANHINVSMRVRKSMACDSSNNTNKNNVNLIFYLLNIYIYFHQFPFGNDGNKETRTVIRLLNRPLRISTRVLKMHLCFYLMSKLILPFLIVPSNLFDIHSNNEKCVFIL